MSKVSRVRPRSALHGFVLLALVGVGSSVSAMTTAWSADVSAGGGSPYNWSGVYAGIHGGGVWGKATVTDTNGGVDPGPFSYSASGVFGGATLGSNMQFGGLVAGIEGDLGYMNLTGAGIIPSSQPPNHQDATLTGGIYGDITGRLGFDVGQTLFYGKGGFAFYTGQATQATTVAGYVPTGTGTFTGWTIGGGFEQRVDTNLSWKVEYQHFSFGPANGSQLSTSDPPVGYVYTNSTTLTAESIKVGLNWKFN